MISFGKSILAVAFTTILGVSMMMSANAQTFNGKNLRWNLDANADKRIKAFFATTGSSMGSEESSLAVENLTETKLAVKFKVTLVDFCGTSTLRNISYTIPPLGKAGFSAWFDGASYSTKCKDGKKWDEKFFSRINSAKIEIVSIQEIQTNVAGAGKKLNCQDLIAYRDKKLVALLDKQTKKYQLNTNMVKDINDLKDSLLKQSNSATSNKNLVILTLKTAANAIEDIINIGTPQGYLLKVAKSSTATTVSRVAFYEIVKKGDKAFEAVASEDVAKTLAVQAATDLGKMVSILAFIKNVHDNIQSLSDYQNVKQEVNKQMANLSKSMASYNSKVTNSQANIKTLNQYKEYIDQYLKENCSK